MKRFYLFCFVFAIYWLTTSSAMAQHVAYKLRQPELVPAAGTEADDTDTRKDAEASPSDQPASHVPAHLSDMTCTTTSCAEPSRDAEQPSCCCEPSCGCVNGCCNTCGCGCGWGWGDCLGDCCLGDAWTLKGAMTPCCDTNYGGWVAIGYYDDNERLSTAPNDLKDFLDNPDHLNLDQAWLYVEKVANGDCCCCDWGYRFDMLYGVDAQKTQSFGNEDNVWDVSLDHGSYGWAMPQAYAQVAYGDWSVKVGHFFTIEGYEVVPATGNFFYSHSYTQFNSEPRTHTGILATNTANACLTWYAGWTLGWDTGFDQFDDGSNFLGGFGLQMTDDVKYTYILTAGNLGFKGDGYSHSNVIDFTLSDCWHYVVESDYVTTNFQVPNTGNDLQDVGLTNYLFYTLNDCWAVGGRAEWWKSNNVTGDADSFQEITGGINYKANANVVLRPEIRYNWTNESAANNTQAFNNTVFAVDAVYTF